MMIGAQKILVEEATRRGLPMKLKREVIVGMARELKVSDGFPDFLKKPGHKVSFGVYNLMPSDQDLVDAANASQAAAPTPAPMTEQIKRDVEDARAQGENLVVISMHDVSYIPRRDPAFVDTRDYKIIRQAIKSGVFFPMYLTGPSGLGKTHVIQEACAYLKREMVRVNFTEETSERHIIGGFRLDSGNTVWEDGPALVAMKRGAVLVLDEVDLGSPKILCLQSILEGASYINKMTGEVVRPAAGFTIIATGNTKGTVSGRNARFIGARAQNEAFMDRFEVTLQMDYPKVELERQILNKFWSIGLGNMSTPETEAFIGALVKWAEEIRNAYNKGSVTDLISTRRLKSALKSYHIYGKVEIALLQILERFPEGSREAFLNFYKAIATIPLGDLNADIAE